MDWPQYPHTPATHWQTITTRRNKNNQLVHIAAWLNLFRDRSHIPSVWTHYPPQWFLILSVKQGAMSKVNTKTRSCLNRSFRRWIFKSNQCKWTSLVRTPGIDQPQHFRNWYMQNVSTSNCTWFVTEVNVNVNTYTKWVLGFVCRNSVRLFKIRQTLCCSTFGCFTFIEYFNVHCVAAVQNLRMFSLECSNFLFGCSRTINKSVKIIHTYTHAPVSYTHLTLPTKRIV